MLRIDYPQGLPISSRARDIRDALVKHAVLIVAGATGSGKTTQLPKLALEVAPPAALIGVTQPRRLAATSVAARVAEELGCSLGQEVGYQIRFEDRSSRETRIKFMTDGILLAELGSDPLFSRYHTLIIDEAHERSLNIDFLLGCLKHALSRRSDLRVIISSATIETGRFSRFFDDAPVIDVAGRTFPVDVLYEPPDPELDLPEAVAQSVSSIAGLDPFGDILVFLPGEREIRDTERELTNLRLRSAQVLPLYSRLSAAEQNRVFATGGARRIILATNVAETSLTLPGIVYVVDCGLARLSRYDTRTGTTRLKVEPISKASADQRKGRCGRVREGICVRLYAEEDFDARPAFTDPEVQRVGLASVILRMKAGRIGEVEDFPFLDAPRPKAVAEGYRILEELGALNDQLQLTDIGRQLARFPLDPRVARMILAGADQGCLAQIVILAAALEIQDPRERPRGLEQKADAAHRRFRDAKSDFVGLLKLWDYVTEAQQQSWSNLKRVCKDEYLSFSRVREWREIHRQLSSVVAEQRLQSRTPQHPAAKQRDSKPNKNSAAQKSREASKSKAAPSVPAGETKQPKPVANVERELHIALLSGLLSRIGQYQPEHKSYRGAKQTRFMIHPSSALAKQPPPWIVAFELVETSQLFARVVAEIEPEWLDGIAAHLLKRSYSEPTWSEKSARASVREHASLFGLPVLRDRSVDFALLSPSRARLIFIEHALVRQEYESPGAFQSYNRKLLDEVALLRGKARKSDMLTDDEARLNFFELRVPAEVVNGKTFETWRLRAEQQSPRLLYLSLTELLANEPELRPEGYPDSLTVQGVQLDLSYRFEPMHDADGVTLTVPLAALPRLRPDCFEWTIPAWHQQRILCLLESLPRPLRMCLEPLGETAADLARRLKAFEGPGLEQLAQAASARAGVPILVSQLRPESLPRHLSNTFRIVSPEGRSLGEGRDLAELKRQFQDESQLAVRQLVNKLDWGLGKHTAWDMGDLPERLLRQIGQTEVAVYPALKDCGSAVERVVMDSAQDAEAATRVAVGRLLALRYASTLASLVPMIPWPYRWQPGAQATLTERTSFVDQVLLRACAEAFRISETAVPRCRADFEALANAGEKGLLSTARRVIAIVLEVSTELQTTGLALLQVEQQRAGAAAVRDVQRQLAELFPEDLLTRIELGRLAHYRRYLLGIQARLRRAASDPRRDADKLASFAPLWQLFEARRVGAKNASQLWALRWALEELRIAIFAPELKTAFPVDTLTLERALKAL